MRIEFHAQLDRLTAELGEMCALTASSIADATAAVVQSDPDALPRVTANLRRLDELNDAVDRRAFSVLALHGPVAHDLRLVMSAFTIAAHADRMGALARNIAKTRGPVPAVTLDLFADMGRTAVAIAEGTHRAVVGDDLSEATAVETRDAQMNDLNRDLIRLVLDHGWAGGVPAATDVVLLGRFYERFADNAVEIARKVIFQASGELPTTSPIPH